MNVIAPEMWFSLEAVGKKRLQIRSIVKVSSMIDRQTLAVSNIFCLEFGFQQGLPLMSRTLKEAV
jgi:hypothetical protein